MPLISIGIDPGFASTGIAAVARMDDGTLRSLGAKVVRTSPSKDKCFTKLRTSMDDERRVRIYWTEITDAIQRMRPNVIGVEAYTIYEPRGTAALKEAAAALLAIIPAGTPGDYLTELAKNRGLAKAYLDRLADLSEALRGEIRGGIGMGAAAKTILVYGTALGAAFTASIPVFVFQPSDLKQAFGGTRSASKDEVGEGLYRIVTGMREHVAAKVPQTTLREHAQDAMGHAVLAVREYVNMALDATGKIGLPGLGGT
jgi:Holliday junction resolvasome RuvABC endonuclease subunit